MSINKAAIKFHYNHHPYPISQMQHSMVFCSVNTFCSYLHKPLILHYNVLFICQCKISHVEIRTDINIAMANNFIIIPWLRVQYHTLGHGMIIMFITYLNCPVKINNNNYHIN